MSDSDELQLIKDAVGGDEDALSALLKRHAPALRESLGGRISKIYQADLSPEDVLQVTYLEVFLQIRKYDVVNEKAFFGWLRRISENNLRDAIRGIEAAKRPGPRNRIEAGATRSAAILLNEICSDSAGTPSRQAAEMEAVEFLSGAVEKLPADYAIVLQMYEFEGKSIADVAKRLNRSEGAVFMMRARAIDRLRGLLPTESKFFSTGQ